MSTFPLAEEEEAAPSRSESVVAVVTPQQPSQQVYTAVCRRFAVTPDKRFQRQLTDSDVIMRYHQLGAKGSRACAVALVVSSMVHW